MSTAILQAESEQRSAAPSRDGRAFRVVRIVLGLLLVTAAGLKLYGLNVTALPRVGWFATPQIQVAAAEWELVLGLWLLSGAAQQLAWLAAIGTFTTFAIVSAYFGWIGVASCGCFGAIRASPWTAFGVDIAAVVGLLIFRPQFGARDASKSERTLARALGSAAMIPLGAAAILLTLTGIGSWFYGSPAVALARLRGDLLTVEPNPIFLGNVTDGQKLRIDVQIRNNGDCVARILGGTTSCGCVVSGDLPVSIPIDSTETIQIDLRITGSPGLFERKFSLYTDHPQKGVLTGRCIGRIVE